MATITNRERVGKALELLKAGLTPYIQRELRVGLGPAWQERALEGLRDTPSLSDTRDPWSDVYVLLQVMGHHWHPVFNKILGQTERNLVSELRGIRNDWAHQQNFSSNDAYRALDSTHRLLSAIAAPQTDTVNEQKQELLRVIYDKQVQYKRKHTTFVFNGQPTEGLPSWRQVVTPHRDVTEGRYQQAEFAADLEAVYRGKASVTDEYRYPQNFFQRTYLTEGLSHLIRTALLRLSKQGGAPVVELQTNFGGGKTHSLLALYHLFSSKIEAADLVGIEPILKEVNLTRLPEVWPVVLVGSSLSPAIVNQNPDGITTRTLWGELAYQLGGEEGYKMMAAADQSGVSPGSNLLYELFMKYGPALILIDEWVSYIRLTYGQGTSLPGGSFDSNLSFAQSLTEAAKQAPGTIVVVSLPQSNQEAGGEGGQEALERLQKIVGRLESAWLPASTEEGFEIVRRRLFQPMTEASQYAARDAVIDAFSRLYQEQPAEFPHGCGEADYARRMTAAYPIHPELFDRLYNDWSSLEKFQRTRGVLQLMATIIQALWERDDKSLLIMPATIPLDHNIVNTELMKYLPDNWRPIVEKDIDGENSLSIKLDRDKNLGRYSACRRVARTIFMGSAPTFRGSNPGLEERNIKLACVQPGEQTSTFSNALRHLTEQANHLYIDRQRYWFNTQPSVTRLAQDRTAQFARSEEAWRTWDELRLRIQKQSSKRGELAAVHVIPISSAEVIDEPTMRLVILGSEHPHSRAPESPAIEEATKILKQRGDMPRLHQNMLVFLAPDKGQLPALATGIQEYLAWHSISEEQDQLNLDAFQKRQTLTKRDDKDKTVEARIRETYVWLLVPEQSDPLNPELEWQKTYLFTKNQLSSTLPLPLPLQVSQKIVNEQLLITKYSAVSLSPILDKFNLWQGQPHVELKKLWQFFTHYLYMPRLKNEVVLLEAIRDGVSQPNWADYFAYAEAFDESRQRYMGLLVGRRSAVSLEGLIVKPEAVQQQLKPPAPVTPVQPAPSVKIEPDADKPLPYETKQESQEVADKPGEYRVKLVMTATSNGQAASLPKKPQHFYGKVALSNLRITSDIAQISEAIIQHLTSLMEANVTVTLEIEADLPHGAPDNVIRTVTENARTLKFKPYGFEE